MRRFLIALVALAALAPIARGLEVGFGALDVTPDVAKKAVWLAGFGKGRKATAIHDPLMVRALVLADGTHKVALVSVDVVGLFHDVAQRVRAGLPGFEYVLVSSTHNHEGPDTLGLWGPTAFQSGLDPAYMKRLEERIVRAVRDADTRRRVVTARIGTARGPELLHDGREPFVKHDELVALRFVAADGKDVGLVVQWNCHPETLSSKNTQVSADFVAATVAHLQDRYRCPVVYFTGTVGGLMTSLHVAVKDAKGNALADGTFAKTERYGALVGALAVKALTDARPVQLTPIVARRREVFLPLANPVFQLGWGLGVLKRQAYHWTGDPDKADPLKAGARAGGKMCIRSEVGYLRLGDLEIAAIPGEIYPELVLGKVQEPADPAADFPGAPIEPSVYGQLKRKHRLIIGLANDEVGYIIPKRQWDEKAPYCYGRKRSQYGEVNSLGPETAPLLCEAFRRLVRESARAGAPPRVNNR